MFCSKKPRNLSCMTESTGVGGGDGGSLNDADSGSIEDVDDADDDNEESQV